MHQFMYSVFSLYDNERHLVHAAVAGGAADALVDVNTVIEVDEIRQVMDARVHSSDSPLR